MSNKDTKVLEKLSNNDKLEDKDVLKGSGKTDEEIIDIIKTVQVQRSQHSENANKAKQIFEREMNLVTKATGFIEIALQMIPKEEVDKMIAEEAKQAENHQANGQKTS